MRIRHTIPETEVEDHNLREACPCDPDLTVTARPSRAPVLTLTHHPFTPRSPR